MENINLEIQKLRTKKIPKFELRKDVLEIETYNKQNSTRLSYGQYKALGRKK